MFKIVCSALFFACLLSAPACQKADDFPGPNAGLQGKVIDSTTGQNLLTETGGMQIKLEELSWDSNPKPQTIPSKPDGTYEDTRLFSGHYRVTPYGGAFWPVKGIEMDINGLTTKDFTVTPYIRILNFSHSMSGDTLVMRFNIDAPIKQGLPHIIDAQPFVNNTPYVGSGAMILDYNRNLQHNIDSDWDDSLLGITYEIKVPAIKLDRTLYARVGVRVNDSYKQWNYSEVVTLPGTK